MPNYYEKSLISLLADRVAGSRMDEIIAVLKDRSLEDVFANTPSEFLLKSSDDFNHLMSLNPDSIEVGGFEPFDRYSGWSVGALQAEVVKSYNLQIKAVICFIKNNGVIC